MRPVLKREPYFHHTGMLAYGNHGYRLNHHIVPAHRCPTHRHPTHQVKQALVKALAISYDNPQLGRLQELINHRCAFTDIDQRTTGQQPRCGKR
jgi:hypothetical protein